jgi:hypothetical protein
MEDTSVAVNNPDNDIRPADVHCTDNGRLVHFDIAHFALSNHHAKRAA